MIDSELQSKANTLASLAALYPEAFALAAASNSRSSLAVRRWEMARLNAPCLRVGQSSEYTLQQSTDGLRVVNPMKV